MSKPRRRILMGAIMAVGAFAVTPALAQDADKPELTLFTNVMVFNGTEDKLIDADVLVEGNMIKQVGSDLSAGGATVIDGGGRTLMPGMVNMHEHLLPNQSFDYILTTGYWDEVGAGAPRPGSGRTFHLGTRRLRGSRHRVGAASVGSKSRSSTSTPARRARPRPFPGARLSSRHLPWRSGSPMWSKGLCG